MKPLRPAPGIMPLQLLRIDPSQRAEIEIGDMRLLPDLPGIAPEIGGMGIRETRMSHRPPKLLCELRLGQDGLSVRRFPVLGRQWKGTEPCVDHEFLQNRDSRHVDEALAQIPPSVERSSARC